MKSTSRSPEAKAWQWLYNTSRWRKLRLLHLASEPLCRMCKQTGRLTPATVVDHIKAHKGDETLFWDQGNWQSLCAHHHNSDAQRIEKGGTPKTQIGVDGWPMEAVCDTLADIKRSGR